MFVKWNGFLSLALVGMLPLYACVEQSQEPQPTEEDVQGARVHVLSKPPAPRYPSQGVLQNSTSGRVAYLGVDVDTDNVTPGQPFTLTHYFRVEQPAPEGWRLFVHLDSPDRRAHLTADHVPVGGKYPVHRWQAGEIIRDIHKVVVPATWPVDKVQIYVGLWKGQARYTVASGRQDGQNRLLAVELPVRGVAAPSPAPLKRLLVRRLTPGTGITVDGKLDEPAWKDAASTGPFVNTLDGSPAEAGRASSARALWDQNNLYVAFEFQDSDVWNTLEKHDDKLWLQDAAELFIDADGDRRTYIELQVSPRNVTFDSWLPTYRANDNAWDAPTVTAVQVQGTVNKSDDKDTGWTVEMQIPLTAARGRLENMRGVPPTVGTEWRVNFFRMDHLTGKPHGATGWSPPLVGDFHALDRFGVLVFADEQGQLTPPPSVSPATAPAATAAEPLAEPQRPGAAKAPPSSAKPAAKPAAKH